MEAATTTPLAHVYLMHMFSERLQILISKDQRRRLEEEAKRRKSSVASVIRGAVEAELGGVPRQDRLRAVQRIATMRAAPYLPPDELRRAIDESRAEGIERGFSAPSGS
jgi:hypothetical protein